MAFSSGVFSSLMFSSAYSCLPVGICPVSGSRCLSFFYFVPVSWLLLSAFFAPSSFLLCLSLCVFGSVSIKVLFFVVAQIKTV